MKAIKFLLFTLIFMCMSTILTGCGDPQDEPLYDGSDSTLVVNPTDEIPVELQGLIDANSNWYTTINTSDGVDTIYFLISVSEDGKSILITRETGSYYTLPVKDIKLEPYSSGDYTYVCKTATLKSGDFIYSDPYEIRFFYESRVVININSDIKLFPVGQ